jgi:hypothetical protein
LAEGTGSSDHSNKPSGSLKAGNYTFRPLSPVLLFIPFTGPMCLRSVIGLDEAVGGGGAGYRR